MQAGIPTQLRLWNKGDDEFEDDPILTQTFKVTEKVTVIPLGNTGIDAKWFEGSWRYLDADTVITLKIIDGTNCSYTAPVPAATGELIPVTTYSTYVFHKENDSLEIAGSDDNDTGGRIWINDSRFYGSQENGSDYIQSDSGNRYQRMK